MAMEEDRSLTSRVLTEQLNVYHSTNSRQNGIQFNFNSNMSLVHLDRLEAAIKSKCRRKKSLIVVTADRMSKVESYNPSKTSDEIYLSTYHILSPKHLQTTLIARQKIGKVYDDLDELTANVKVWIALKKHDFFTRGIDCFPSKCDAVIEVNDKYTSLIIKPDFSSLKKKSYVL